jgi:ethanolamine ammonia-lyase large subunit
MGIPPDQLQEVTARVAEMAAPAYLMAVAGNADPMLGYLTTSFREHPRLRRRFKKSIATPMQARLQRLGVIDDSGELNEQRQSTERLYAAYMKSGGDLRSAETLCSEAARKLDSLRLRGFDLGIGCGNDSSAPPEVEARMKSIYANARSAL